VRTNVVCGSAAVGVAGTLVTAVVHDAAAVRNPDIDPFYYWGMANGHTVLAPFGYRVLVPGLVRALPLDHDAGFVLLTGVALAVLVGALFTWLERHTTPARAVAGTALVVGSVGWTQFQAPYRNDMAMLALLALAAVAADRDRWGWFTVAAIGAVLARDSGVIVALVPLAGFVLTRDRRALTAAFTTAAVFLLVRGLVPVVPRPLQLPSEILPFRAAMDGGLAASFLLAAGASFGAAWILVPLAWRRIDVRSRRWALPAVASMLTLLVGSDWARLLAPAALVVAIAVVRAPVRTWGLWTVTGSVALASYQANNVAWVLATLCLGVAATVASRDQQRAESDVVTV
jgi:hypothetical protein